MAWCCRAIGADVFFTKMTDAATVIALVICVGLSEIVSEIRIFTAFPFV